MKRDIILKERNIAIPNYKVLKTEKFDSSAEVENVALRPELRNWPIQLQLINPNSPYFKNADLLIAADCAPFAFPNFNNEFLKDKALIIFCPKLDTVIDQYIDKLSEIFKNQDIKSITIARMQVPCCSGIEIIVKRALEKANKEIDIKNITVGINGEILD